MAVKHFKQDTISLSMAPLIALINHINVWKEVIISTCTRIEIRYSIIV